MITNDNQALQNDQIGPNFGNPPPAPIPPPVAPAPAPVVPPVPSAPTGPGPGIVSSSDATKVLDQGGADLDNMTSQSDPYLEYLQKQANNLQNGTDETNSGSEKVDIANATTQASNLQNKVQSDYARYKAGLETLGIQSGLASIAPDLQAGRLLQAANDETTKIADIQQKEDYAIAKAKQARQDKDAVTLKSTLSEIAQIKKDKAQAIKDQMDKRSRDITIANSLSTYAYKSLQDLPDEKKEAFILQTAKDNDISPAALIAALAKEDDTQKKFDLGIKLQEKALNKASTPAAAKPLSTAALNYIKKQNPLVDLGYGDTQDDADAALSAAQEVQSGVKTAFNNPGLVRNGRYTFDYINNVLNNLPQGVNRVAFLTSIRDRLALGSDKNAKQYGITPEERAEIIAS